ncbi:CRAL-TRIO domain-containing protein [Infundibulicybe gibba]|nr:CRAL-TRIO domain-containing protein [Infundibulicybe gibba]
MCSRFLRARGFDPSQAQKQFADAESWRRKHDVDNLFATFDAEEFESAKRFYPRWTGRRDKNGVPLHVYHIASLVPLQKELNAVPPARRYQRIVALYEFITRFSLPLCTHLPHPESTTPITNTTSIVDLSDVSFMSLWSLRSHLGEASRLASDNYPETLCSVVVVNAPSFFPTVWGWIKGWFDPHTRSKIHVLSNDLSSLHELVHMPDLPKVYGGELEWTFEDEPSLDKDASEVLGGVMPRGPVIFVDGRVAAPGAGQKGAEADG